MDLGADVPIVEGADFGHCDFTDGYEVGSADVFFGLGRALGAGDGAGDGVEHQDPTQCKLGKRCTMRTEPFQLLDGF